MTTRILGGVAVLALALAGCTAPLTPDSPPPAPSPTPSPTVTARGEIEAGGEVAGDGAEFDPTCLEVPEALTEWLAKNSWQYSKTRPIGKGEMVAAGGGWYIAAVPTTGDFDVKGWAWVPGPKDSVVHVMPLPADWEDIDPDDEENPAHYYKANLPIEDGAYTAAMECLGS